MTTYKQPRKLKEIAENESSTDFNRNKCYRRKSKWHYPNESSTSNMNTKSRLKENGSSKSMNVLMNDTAVDKNSTLEQEGNSRNNTKYRRKKSCESPENSSAASTVDSEHDISVDTSDLSSLISTVDTICSYTSFSGNLTAEIQSLVYVVDQHMLQLGVERQHVIDILRHKAANVLHDVIGVDFEIFGSVSTNLALPSSDVDCVIKYDTVRCMQPNVSIVMLNKLAKTLGTMDAFKELNLLLSAKVPVLKFKYQTKSHGSLMFDVTSIASAQHSGTQARNLVQDFMKRMPTLRPIVLVLKAHLHTCGLNEPYSGGMASYAIVLMTIRYLQYCGQICDLGHVPFSNCGRKDCQRCRKNYQVQHSDVGTLLVQWLQFYTAFDYSRFGISINNNGGYYVLKYKNVSNIPWIDDPFRPGMNMCSSFRMQEVLQVWRNLLLNLQNHVSLCQLVFIHSSK